MKTASWRQFRTSNRKRSSTFSRVSLSFGFSLRFVELRLDLEQALVRKVDRVPHPIAPSRPPQGHRREVRPSSIEDTVKAAALRNAAASCAEKEPAYPGSSRMPLNSSNGLHSNLNPELDLRSVHPDIAARRASYSLGISGPSEANPAARPIDLGRGVVPAHGGAQDHAVAFGRDLAIARPYQAAEGHEPPGRAVGPVAPLAPILDGAFPQVPIHCLRIGGTRAAMPAVPSASWPTVTCWMRGSQCGSQDRDLGLSRRPQADLSGVCLGST